MLLLPFFCADNGQDKEHKKQKAANETFTDIDAVDAQYKEEKKNRCAAVMCFLMAGVDSEDEKDEDDYSGGGEEENYVWRVDVMG